MLHNSIACIFVWNITTAAKFLAGLLWTNAVVPVTADVQDYQETRPLSSKTPLSSSHSFISSALLLQWFVWQHHSRHHLHLPGSAQPHLHPSGGRVPAGPAPFPHSQGNTGQVVCWPGHVQTCCIRFLFSDLVILKLCRFSEHPEDPLFRSPGPGG